MSHSTQPQKRVQVKVLKHLPLGLLIELENHQHGIVRVREISWDEKKRQNWRTLRPFGWVGWAVPITGHQSEHPEYSLRLAENDPWDEIPATISKQQIYEGTVTGVTAFGAFIELASGLTGLLHKSQFPVWAKGEPIDIFWPGDRVHVTIQAADRDARRISLGLPPISAPPTDGITPQKASKGFRNTGEHATELDEFLNSGAPKKHILLVEDEPEQQTAISNWLVRVGQRVDAVDSAEKAIRFLETSQPDLALIDVGLPGMSGTDLAGLIRERWPQVQVAIAADWARQETMTEVLDQLRANGVDLYPKPLLPEDLITLLKQDKDSPADLLTVSTDAPKSGITLSDIPGIGSKTSILGVLNQCRRHLGFDQALLFEFDPIHRVTSIPERSGESLLDKNVLPSLVYSPVRDVAEDQEVIVITEIGPHEGDRFRYLLELSPTMKSCIGVPVKAEMQSDFALFLLSKHPKQVSKEQRIYAEAMAQSIGTLLEQKNFKEKSILIQRTALIGHLTRAMVHEINNLVGPLASRLDNLQSNLARLEKSPNQADAQERKTILLSGALSETQQIILRIINTTRMFGRIVSKGKNEILRVDQIIEETIHLLRDTSDRAHVQVVFNPPEQMQIIRNQAAAFEQVLLNVMLNAVQQISETRPETGGWVQVRIDEDVDSTKAGFFRLLIEDNGPGIHTRLWTKVFEAGYSTRHEGSGIGLYISRNLVEDMGGQIYVKASSVLGGTIFALEIPSQL